MSPSGEPRARRRVGAAVRLMAGRLRLDGRRDRGAGTLAVPPPAAASDGPLATLPFDASEFESRLTWILGAPRTGSTWLLRLLIHPWILARGTESGMRAPLRRRGLPDVVPIDESYLLHHLAPLVPVPDGLSEQPTTDRFVINGTRRAEPGYFFSDAYVEAWAPELRRLVLVRLHATARAAAEDHGLQDPLVLIKEPNGSHAAELLMSLVPRSRLIFLLRHGGDVIDSMLDARGGEGWVGTPNMDLSDPEERLAFVRRQARLWLNYTNAVQSACAAHPGELRITVRYEDLRSDTAATLGPLLEWLGIGRGETALRDAIEANAFESLPGFAKGPGTPRRAATPGLWRENMGAAEQETMLAIIGPKLVELGYETS
jgi:hypothetical protein